MSKLSDNIWGKLILFAVAAVLLFYFWPRSDTRHYTYEINRPWAYSLLTAPFDIPVERDSIAAAAIRDSIDASFVPVFRRDESPKAAILEAIRKATSITPSERLRLAKAVERVYATGIVDNPTYTIIQAGSLPQMKFIENSVATTVLSSGFLSQRQAYQQIDAEFTTSEAKRDIQALKLSSLLNPNVLRDTVETKRLYDEKITRAMAPIGVIQQGERIIDKGDIVTPQLFTILQTYENMARNNASGMDGALYLTWLGILFYILICLSSLGFYLALFRKRIWDRQKSVMCILILTVGLYILAAVTHTLVWAALYVVPLAILPIALTVLFDSRTATFCLIMIVLLVMPLSTFPMEFVFVQTIAGLTAIYSLKEFSRRSQLIRSAALVFVAYALSYTALELSLNGDFATVSPRMIGYFGINAVLLSFAYMLIFILEKAFGFTSVVTMVELSDINNPVLRELSQECPGTFQHSMALSTLASDAAQRVGANVQLVRTAALYHDIGKLNNSAFFTENQHGVNPHDALDPTQSAKIVIRHVTDGLARASKEKLPQVIKDFIAQHHGRGKAKYFYNTYCRQHPDEEIDENLFTYPGPNPQTREASIMMMADAVEAASRSLKDYSPESITALVNKIIDGQIADGLHSESPISFRDIATIKDAFIRRLRTMYHARVSYPEDIKRQR